MRNRGQWTGRQLEQRQGWRRTRGLVVWQARRSTRSAQGPRGGGRFSSLFFALSAIRLLAPLFSIYIPVTYIHSAASLREQSRTLTLTDVCRGQAAITSSKSISPADPHTLFCLLSGNPLTCLLLFPGSESRRAIRFEQWHGIAGSGSAVLRVRFAEQWAAVMRSPRRWIYLTGVCSNGTAARWANSIASSERAGMARKFLLSVWLCGTRARCRNLPVPPRGSSLTAAVCRDRAD